MNERGQYSLGEGRQLLQQLQNLGVVKAPPTIIPVVLTRVGLADAYYRLESPIGPIFVAYNDLGISRIMRTDDPAQFEAGFRARFGRAAYPVSQPPAELAEAIRRRLAGDEQVSVRFDLRGLSEFERAVLHKALEIPRGEVRPYGWVAREIGHPRAVRAVGSALGRNPIPLLIPCHRVVRSDGHIGYYGYGIAAKRMILEAEGLDPQRLEELADAGVRYYGSDTTHKFCYPTCRHARRIADEHRVLFRSTAEALAAGYAPCRVCRPAALVS